MEVILNLGEPFRCRGDDGQWHRQPRCFVSGQITRPLLVKSAGDAQVLGIRLTPSGARALLRVPCSELTNRREELGSVAPSLARALEAAAEAAAAGRIAALEGALIEHAAGQRPDPQVEAAVGTIRKRNGDLPIDDVSRVTGLAPRQLQRRFQEWVGVGPKLLARMLRLQAVLRAAGRRPGTGWGGAGDGVRLLRPEPPDPRFPAVRRAAAGNPAAGRLRLGALLHRQRAVARAVTLFSKTGDA
jgi:AraC-like DNA-binding protein